VKKNFTYCNHGTSYESQNPPPPHSPPEGDMVPQPPAASDPPSPLPLSPPPTGVIRRRPGDADGGESSSPTSQRRGWDPSSSMAAEHRREVWSGVGSRDDRSGRRQRLNSNSRRPISDGFDQDSSGPGLCCGRLPDGGGGGCLRRRTLAAVEVQGDGPIG
jgi:hypothetical protein